VYRRPRPLQREEPGEEPGGLPWAYLGGGFPEKVSNLRGPPGLLWSGVYQLRHPHEQAERGLSPSVLTASDGRRRTSPAPPRALPRPPRAPSTRRASDTPSCSSSHDAEGRRLAKAPTVFRGLRKIHLLLGTSVHKCGRKRRSALRLGPDTEAGSSLGDALVVPRNPVALAELLGRARRGYRPFVKLERGLPAGDPQYSPLV
jgi:hypothetical protein